ncbi:(S)-benzoin forming benzil reductase [Oceanobacillus sp. CAU 1775]
MSNLAIITGISRGLGASLAKLLLDSGVDVIGISRTENSSLVKLSAENNKFYKHFSCDLSDIASLDQVIVDIQEVIKEREGQIETLYLLNNAGVVHPINQAMQIDSSELISHVTINTIAPMVLTNKLLKFSTEQSVPMIVANVSSGAAESAIYGWSAYCSTKASLNMYTKTVALEQDELETGHKIIAFSPGIMDTEMQENIRKSSADEFAEVERFKEYKSNDLLRQTDIVAGVLIDIITDEDVKNGKVYNIKNYL